MCTLNFFSISEMLGFHVHIKVMVNLKKKSSQFNHVESNNHICHAMLCAKHPAMFLLEIYF